MKKCDDGKIAVFLLPELLYHMKVIMMSPLCLWGACIWHMIDRVLPLGSIRRYYVKVMYDALRSSGTIKPLLTRHLGCFTDESHPPIETSGPLLADRKNILFIDASLPQFDKNAGDRTVFMYLRLFVSMGYNVLFMPADFQTNTYAEILEKYGIKVLASSWLRTKWHSWLEREGERVDLVFFSRPAPAYSFIEEVKRLTKAKIIYYGHDLHSLRILREAVMKNSLLLKAKARYEKEREDYILARADVAYYPSDFEVRFLQMNGAYKNVHVLTPYLYKDFSWKEADFYAREGLLFVGGFWHHPNADAVLWFCKEVLPLILQKKPHVRFYVVGSHPSKEILSLDSDNVIVKGFVSDEELESLYRSVKLVVVPLRYGAGIKGKVVEALKHGVPMITTSIGAEGIPDLERIVPVVDSAEDFANVVLELYDDDERLAEISKRSVEYARDHYSEEAARQRIESDFKTLASGER